MNLDYSRRLEETEVLTHVPLKLSEFQERNLKALAQHLAALPDVMFGMGHFAFSKKAGGFSSPETLLMSDCDTVCCAAGNGPLIGIEPHHDEGWIDYVNRVFGAKGRVSQELTGSLALFDWCFCGSWAVIDNAPKGAAARIEYVFKYGVPTCHSAYGARINEYVYQLYLFRKNQP